MIVYDPATADFCEVGEGDLPLGVMDDAEYREQTSAPLQPGQVLFIGTDGVWELPDEKGDQFGKDRLREVIRETAARTADEIAAAVRESPDRLPRRYQSGGRRDVRHCQGTLPHRADRSRLSETTAISPFANVR